MSQLGQITLGCDYCDVRFVLDQDA